MKAQWWNKLTKAQQRHLTEMGITSLQGFKTTCVVQLVSMKTLTTPEHMHPETLHGCWECREIAERLNLKELI